jgi:hypothetical protein
MFWNKSKNAEQTNLNSADYEKLLKKSVEVTAKIEELQIKLEVLRTDLQDMRGKFNRKLRGIRLEDQEEQEKDINNPVILPYNGSFK